MQRMQAIGAPFPLTGSSCSNRVPARFRWTHADCPIKVYIDRAILAGALYTKRPGETKVGWICESRAIFHAWALTSEKLAAYLPMLEDAYDAIFVSERALLATSPVFRFSAAGSNLPWIRGDAAAIHPKSRSASMFVSHKQITPGHARRHRIAHALGDGVDIFGGVLGPRIGDDGSPWPDKSAALVSYMFHIAVENDRYETYYSEKLTDCFATGTLPIYWGAPDIGDTFDPDGVIAFDDLPDLASLTPDLYHDKRDVIRANFERCRALVGADDQLFERIMQLR